NMNRIYPFKRKAQVGKPRWYEQIATQATLQSSNTISMADSLYRRPGLLNRFTNGVQFQAPVTYSFQAFKYFNVTSSVNVLGRGYFSSISKSFDPTQQLLLVDTLRNF